MRNARVYAWSAAFFFVVDGGFTLLRHGDDWLEALIWFSLALVFFGAGAREPSGGGETREDRSEGT